MAAFDHFCSVYADLRYICKYLLQTSTDQEVSIRKLLLTSTNTILIKLTLMISRAKCIACHSWFKFRDPGW